MTENESVINTPAETPSSDNTGKNKDQLIKRLFLVAVIVVAGLIYFQQRRDVELKDWSNDLDGSLKIALDEGRPVVLCFLPTHQNQATKDLIKKTLGFFSVKKPLDKYNYVKIAIVGDITSPEAQRFSVTTLPTTFLLDSYGLPNKRLEGSVTAQEMIELLGRYAPKK